MNRGNDFDTSTAMILWTFLTDKSSSTWLKHANHKNRRWRR